MTRGFFFFPGLRYATSREYSVQCIKRRRDELPFAHCPHKAAVNGTTGVKVLIVTQLQGLCRDPIVRPPKSREMLDVGSLAPFHHPRHGNGVEVVASLVYS